MNATLLIYSFLKNASSVTLHIQFAMSRMTRESIGNQWGIDGKSIVSDCGKNPATVIDW